MFDFFYNKFNNNNTTNNNINNINKKNNNNNQINLIKTIINNLYIRKIIFKYIKIITRNKLPCYNQYRVFNWQQLIESPSALVGNGYQSLLEQYHKRYRMVYKDINDSANVERSQIHRQITNAIITNQIPILNYYFDVLKFKITNFEPHSITLLMYKASQYHRFDIILYLLKRADKLMKDTPSEYANWLHYAVLNVPFSQGPEVFRAIRPYVPMDCLLAFKNPTVYDNAAFTGRIDILDSLLPKRHGSYYIDGHQMYEYAVKGNQISVIEYLVNTAKLPYRYRESNDSKPHPYLLNLAVQHNNFEIIKYLYQKSIQSNNGWSNIVGSYILDSAYNSDLDILVWLNDIYNPSQQTQQQNITNTKSSPSQSPSTLKTYVAYTHELMDFAAEHGRLDIIQWVHNNLSKGCTTKAMDCSAENGHFEIVKWLHENRTEGCTTAAMDYAAKNGYLEIVQWLHINRTEGCTTYAMDNAAINGHFSVVEWLHKCRTESCSTLAIDSNQNLEMIRWLHSNTKGGCTTRIIERALHCENTEIIQWLHENRTEHLEYGPLLSELLLRGLNDWFKIYINFDIGTIKQNSQDKIFYNKVLLVSSLNIIIDKEYNQANEDMFIWMMKRMYSVHILQDFRSKLSQAKKSTVFIKLIDNHILNNR